MIEKKSFKNCINKFKKNNQNVGKIKFIIEMKKLFQN